MQIEENQKVIAKNKFKEFDNVLVFPLEFYKDNYKGQVAQKVVDDVINLSTLRNIF